jgi:hypothetical protein
LLFTVVKVTLLPCRSTSSPCSTLYAPLPESIFASIVPIPCMSMRSIKPIIVFSKTQISSYFTRLYTQIAMK